MYKIAVLDDDESWSKAIQRFLSKHGFEVDTFTSPPDFQSHAHHYDLALIDFYLSSAPNGIRDLNGYTVISHLKQQLDPCPIWVLASALINMESARVFPDADFFLIKEIGLDAILKRIQELLAFRETAQKNYQAPNNGHSNELALGFA